MFIDRPVGIDLGTTNSEIAILDPSEQDLHVYADRFGRQTVPSAVAWDPKKEAFLVGRAARNRRGRSPGPVESIKRRMGRDVKVALGPHELSPAEVSAKILAELRSLMREHLQGGAPEGIDVQVRRAVITVPAYFDAPQMEATHKAGELAGLEVLGILQEPTAAAIFHTWRHELGDGNFLIYDLGGGTFDVSILRCLAGEYQVLAIDGDNFLGGDDFDRRYAEHLRKHLAGAGYRLDLDVQGDTDDAVRFQRLVHAAQEIKELLSASEVISFSKTDFFEDQDGEAVSLEMEIGRAEYEAIVADLVETTLGCCDRALAQSKASANVGIESIDHVILVGGSTRVPAVIRAVTDRLCVPSRAEAPFQEQVDTCVALGAAIHAAQLGGLRLGDDETAVRFKTPFVSSKPSIRVELEVEPATKPGAQPIDAVAILGDAGTLAEANLEGSTARLEVPLARDGENRVRLRLIRSGEAAAELPFAVYRGVKKLRASSLSQPSVVAKDLALDVVRAGRRQRKILVPKGSGLPLKVEHRFFTGDQSGAVVLRLLQNRLPIKTLVIEVPAELEVGTPVDLTLSIDEAMRMEAAANVAGQELWARIEPAELDTPSSAADVESLLDEAESVLKGLWGTDAASFKRQHEPLAAGLRETLGTDPDKAAHLAARLRLLLDNFRDESASEMAPPMFRFEHLMGRLRQEVFSSGGELMGLTIEAWETRIADLESRGEKAFESLDARGWRRTYNEAQALVETAGERRWAETRSLGAAHWLTKLRNLEQWAQRLRTDLDGFVASSATEVRSRQETERARLAQSIEAVLTKLTVPAEIEPNELRVVVDGAEAELVQIASAFERLPQLGIVTDRG